MLAGLACDPNIWHSTAQKLKAIVKSHFDAVGEQPKELHYHDIIHKRYPYNKIDGKKLADDVFSLINSLDVTLFAMVLDKHAHSKKYVSPLPADQYMLEAMTNRFELFLRRINDVGIMVFDKVGGPSDHTLSVLFEEFKKKGTHFQQLTKVIDTIFFTPSETSVFLQLTDFVAYAVFAKYERGQDQRYKQIELKFDKFGLREFP